MDLLRPCLIGLLFFALSSPAATAQYAMSAGDSPASRAASTEGLITYTVTRGDSVLARRTIDLNEEQKVIVQFQDPPLSTLSTSSFAGVQRPSLAGASSVLQSRIASTHARFRSDLVRLEGEGRAAGSPGTNTLQAARSRLTREYQQVFNGMALTTRRWLIDRLRTLPYVKAVWPDREVRITDQGSNHQISADSVWAELGATGDSVRIGILDTGIDYTLADLGGGLGPGHKVAGGWDFVNNDPDPADDEGHGTHVAGIIAANGPTLKGVAPSATLYAYKVLNADGYGYSSIIIAALERSVDPDGDPSTDDCLDIVNLSLGGSGDPTDPLSQAIDNTTVAGVLCAVAAGNEGFKPQGIGSPGCAASALTVGACDSTDALADFSSRGPTDFLFTIKPDLVAPGVDVTSVVPGGNHESGSGTSMAAPHAAGAAALLKQLHRDWSPEMLKSALMGGARRLGLPVFQAGTGRLDVLKAARRRVLASPQTLSFGLDPLSQSRWTVTDTVTIYNLTDSSKAFSVSSVANLPAGVSFIPDAFIIAVPPHEARPLQFRLEVDNSLVQIPAQDAGQVSGEVTLLSGPDTLRLPWAMVIATYLDVKLASLTGLGAIAYFTRLSDGMVPSVSPSFYSYSDGCWHLRCLLQPGAYEMVTLMIRGDSAGGGKQGLTWLVCDSVNVNRVATVTMTENDACYRVGTTLRGEAGTVIDSTLRVYWATGLTSKRAGAKYGIMGIGFPVSALLLPDRVNPLSSNFVFEYYYTTQSNLPKLYSYAGRASPVVSDQVTDIQPGDLIRHDIEYRSHAGDLHMNSIQTLGLSASSYGGFSFYDRNSSGFAAPFHQVWFGQGVPAENFPWNGALRNYLVWFESTGVPPFDPFVSKWRFYTPNQVQGRDGVLRSSLFQAASPVQESRGSNVIYGLGPRHYFGRMDNTTTDLKVKTNTPVGLLAFGFGSPEYVPLFVNQAMDFEHDSVSFFLQDSTRHIIDAGTISDHVYFEPAEGVPAGSLTLHLPRAGRYTLHLSNRSNYVLSLKGLASVDLAFDSRRADPNPPTMTSFNIFGADSEYTDMLLPAEAGRVEFRVGDTESGLGQVSLFYHTDSSRAWQTLPLSAQGDLYRTQLPAFAASGGFISFRVLATDQAGNSLDYQAEPALYIGKDYTYANRAPEKPPLLTPTPGGLLQLYEPVRWVVFTWNSALDYDGWDTLSYTFHIRGSGLGTAADRWLRDTTLAFNFMSYLAPDEIYRWWVETTDGHTVTVSDTATFRTSSTILAAPGEENDLPKAFALRQNFPNPFNPTTTIRYELPSEAQVTLKVYNLLGQEVMTVVDAQQRAGRYNVQVDAHHLASGLYIYRLQALSAGGFTGAKEGVFCAVKKFLLVR